MTWIIMVNLEQYPHRAVFSSEVEIRDPEDLPEAVKRQFTGKRILSVGCVPADGFAYNV